MTDSPAYSPGREAYRQQQQSLGPPMLERAVSGDTQQESDGSYSRVYLRCYAELPIGQSLAVLGDTNSFGGNRKENAVLLYTTPQSYPVWTSLEPFVVNSDKIISYRYGIWERGECTVLEHEIAANDNMNDNNNDNNNNHSAKKTQKLKNRTLLAKGYDLVIEDIFDFPKQVRQNNRSMDELELIAESKGMVATKSQDFQTTIQQFTSDSKSLYLVCFHLPIVVKRSINGIKNEFDITWAESLIAKTQGSVSEGMTTWWVGTVSISGDPLTSDETKALKNQLYDMRCIAIFLDPQIHHNTYRGYCKQIMWPVFHNVDLMDQLSAVWNTEGVYSKLGENYQDWIKAYRESTRIFDEMLASIVKQGDIVWVHDYHMMLLPKALRARNLGAHVVYFVHIPFPTSQIFRSLPDALELLESMTCADVVGFHSFDYTRHFLNACKRMLGLKSKTIPGGLLVVTVGLRELIVTMSHVSIEPNVLDEALADEETKQMAEAIRKKHVGKKIIVSVDVAQRLSGGSLRYLAYEALLMDNQNLIEVQAEESRPISGKQLVKRQSVLPGTKVVLIDRAICNNARPEDQQATTNEMKEMIDTIHEKFHDAIDYEEVSSLSVKERVALWLAADVFLSTSIREGLNLMPMEYIYARKDLDNAGVVVASEFSTCSALLNGGLKVNPFNIQACADQIDKALHMSSNEMKSRRLRDIHFVSTHPSAEWTLQILTEIALFNESISKKPTIKKAMPSLIDHNLLTNAYLASENVGISKQCRRVFIFDYGGTLLQSEKQEIYMKKSLSAISGRKPSPRCMKSLQILCNDPNNVVMVVTGLTKMKLGDTFKDFPNLTIVTSNGLVYSWGDNMKSDDILGDDDNNNKYDGGSSSSNSSTNIVMEGIGTDANGRLWGCLDFNIDWNAVKKIAIPIINQFTFRTNGTCQSPRIPGIGWSYFGADPDWGIKQAKQLSVELEAALAHFDIKITSQIQGSIEIVPRALDKGIFVKKFIRRALEKRGGKYPPFVMIVGDEISDDFMHKALYKEIATSSPAAAVKDMKAFTINVGKRETPADLYAYNVQDVENMIVHLADVTTERQQQQRLEEEKEPVMRTQIAHVETGISSGGY